MSVPDLDIKIHPQHIEDQVKDLLNTLKGWPKEEIQIKQLSGGYINVILQCFVTTNGGESVVVRIFKDYLATVTTKNREIAVVKALNKRRPRPIPALHVTFINGYCFDFYEGQMLSANFKWFTQLEAISAFTKSLVSFHLTDVPETTKDLNIFDDLRFWIPKAPDQNWIQAQKAIPGFCSQENLLREVDTLEEKLKNFPSPIVLCHGDCHLANTLWNFNDDHVAFVDMELTRYNFQAIDIAYHFLSFHFEPINKGQPMPFENEETFQKMWLKTYLEHWFAATEKNPKDVTKKDVDNLHIQVKKYSLVTSIIIMTMMLTLPEVEGFNPHTLTSVGFNHYNKNAASYLQLQLIR